MKCPQCGNELKQTDKFCPECGEKVEQRNISECPMCHQPISKGVIICPNCKNNIHTYNTTPPSSADKDLNKKNIIFTITFIICCIAAVFGIVFAAESCTNDSTEKTEPKATAKVQTTTMQNTKNMDNLTKEIYAKDISFKVSSSWNSDKSHSIYNCSDTCIFTFNFKKTSSDLSDEKYNEIYNSSSEINYLSHKEIELKKADLIIADYIDSDNYYYNAGFYYEGYFYSFSLSDKQSKQEYCSQLGDKIIDTIKIYESTQKQTEEQTKKATEKPTEKTTEKPKEKSTEKESIINNTSTDGFWAKGEGDYVATNLNVTGYGVLNITYSGGSNFIVKLYENDKVKKLLVNEIGNYSGSILIEDSGTFDIEIKSSGSWDITSSGLTIDDTTSFSGNGDSVTGITSHSGGNWHLTHNGGSNFIVKKYGLNSKNKELVINEIGQYDGTVKIKSGDDIFFEIIADGDWTINKE